LTISGFVGKNENFRKKPENDTKQDENFDLKKHYRDILTAAAPITPPPKCP